MSDPAPKPLIDRTITLGAMIQIGVLLIGFITYQTQSSGRAENTADQVKRLEAQVSTQATQTRDSIRESVSRVEIAVSSLQSQVTALPTLNERVRQADDQAKRFESRLAEMQRYLDERRGVLDARFQTLEQRAIEGIADRRELRSMLDAMQRASAVNLPGRPGSRQ